MPDCPLTESAIRALEAGPATDRLVAEHFLGWHKQAHCWVNTEGKFQGFVGTIEDLAGPRWSCSSDARHALAVWEEMARRDWLLSVFRSVESDELWIGSLVLKTLAGYPRASTLPLLIARAALLTLLHQPQGERP